MVTIQDGVAEYPSRWEPPQVRLKRCECGVFDGEWCDCAEFAAQVEASPAIYFTAGTWRNEP